MGDMPCGLCVVCDEELDHSEAGFCVECGHGFHWSQCGEWGDSGHACNNCKPKEDEE